MTKFPNRFYVYAHYRVSDGRLFYIGKGEGCRATNKVYRNEYWKRIERKHGRKVVYIKRAMQEACAHTLEKILISIAGRENLANFSDGGEGVSGITEENRKKKSEALSGLKGRYSDKTVYDFYHPNYGRLLATKFFMRKIFGINSSSLSKLCIEKEGTKSINGWSLYKNKDKPKGKSGPNSSTKNTIVKLQNDDGRLWTGNPYDFCKEFSYNSTNFWKLRKGIEAKYYGWRIINETTS